MEDDKKSSILRRFSFNKNTDNLAPIDTTVGNLVTRFDFGNFHYFNNEQKIQVLRNYADNLNSEFLKIQKNTEAYKRNFNTINSRIEGLRRETDAVHRDFQRFKRTVLQQQRSRDKEAEGREEFLKLQRETSAGISKKEFEKWKKKFAENAKKDEGGILNTVTDVITEGLKYGAGALGTYAAMKSGGIAGAMRQFIFHSLSKVPLGTVGLAAGGAVAAGSILAAIMANETRSEALAKDVEDAKNEIEKLRAAKALTSSTKASTSRTVDKDIQSTRRAVESMKKSNAPTFETADVLLEHYRLQFNKYQSTQKRNELIDEMQEELDRLGLNDREKQQIKLKFPRGIQNMIDRRSTRRKIQQRRSQRKTKKLDTPAAAIGPGPQQLQAAERKRSTVSTPETYNRMKTIDEKKRFLMYGDLTEGFRIHSGIAASPGNIAPGRFQRFGGGGGGGSLGGGYTGSGAMAPSGTYKNVAPSIARSRQSSPQTALGLPPMLGASKGATDPGLGHIAIGKQDAGLSSLRKKAFEQELKNPRVRKQLLALMKIEVGGMPLEAQQDWMETLFNRAAVSGGTLMSRLQGRNRAYWGGGIGNANSISDAELKEFDQSIFTPLMEGRNRTNIMTDNASSTLAQRRIGKLQREGRGDQWMKTQGGETLYVDTPYAKRRQKYLEQIRQENERIGKRKNAGINREDPEGLKRAQDVLKKIAPKTATPAAPGLRTFAPTQSSFAQSGAGTLGDKEQWTGTTLHQAGFQTLKEQLAWMSGKGNKDRLGYGGLIDFAGDNATLIQTADPRQKTYHTGGTISKDGQDASINQLFTSIAYIGKFDAKKMQKLLEDGTLAKWFADRPGSLENILTHADLIKQKTSGVNAGDRNRLGYNKGRGEAAPFKDWIIANQKQLQQQVTDYRKSGQKQGPGGQVGPKGPSHALRPKVQMTGKVIQDQMRVAGTRKGQLDPKLNQILTYSSAQASEFAGAPVRVRVTSGGQRMPGAPGAVGSRRHDGGRSADLELEMYDKETGKWRTLRETNRKDLPIIAKFTETSIQGGATGVGAGASYMANGRIHVGFGAPGTWGPTMRGGSTPPWLRHTHANAMKNPIDIQQKIESGEISLVEGDMPGIKDLAYQSSPAALAKVDPRYNRRRMIANQQSAASARLAQEVGMLKEKQAEAEEEFKMIKEQGLTPESRQWRERRHMIRQDEAGWQIPNMRLAQEAGMLPNEQKEALQGAQEIVNERKAEKLNRHVKDTIERAERRGEVIRQQREDSKTNQEVPAPAPSGDNDRAPPGIGKPDPEPTESITKESSGGADTGWQVPRSGGRYNPESEPESPGTGGYGSYSRCFV